VTFHDEERLKKVVLWRICSLTITLLSTWLYTGSVKEATFFAMALHATLIVAHYMFEYWWEKRL
jgi:uncharacterized membrane protein